MKNNKSEKIKNVFVVISWDTAVNDDDEPIIIGVYSSEEAIFEGLADTMSEGRIKELIKDGETSIELDEDEFGEGEVIYKLSKEKIQ
jgi:hypothetical protein